MLPSATFFLRFVAAVTTAGLVGAQQSNTESPRIMYAPTTVEIGKTYEITYMPADATVIFRAQFGEDANMNSTVSTLSPRIYNGRFSWTVGSIFAPAEGLFLMCQDPDMPETMDTFDFRYISIARVAAASMTTSYYRTSSMMISQTSSIEAMMMDTTASLTTPTNSPKETQMMMPPSSTGQPSNQSLPAMAVAGIGAGVSVVTVVIVLVGCALYKRRRQKDRTKPFSLGLRWPWRWIHSHQSTESRASSPEFKQELDGKGLITVCFCEMNAKRDAQELPADEKHAENEQMSEGQQRRDSMLTGISSEEGQSQVQEQVQEQEQEQEQEQRGEEQEETKDEEQGPRQRQQESEQAV